MHYISAILNRLFTMIHLSFVKIIHGKHFCFHGISIVSSTSHFNIHDNGRIILGKNVGIRRNCEISTSENGKIEIGDKSFLNNGCMVVAHKSITIGQGTRLGPSVMIFDHDYDYKNRETFLLGKHISDEIIIGNNCWIGAGVVILKGSKIGDNCVIGAGTVIKGKYDNGSLIVQKREERVTVL